MSNKIDFMAKVYKNNGQEPKYLRNHFTDHIRNMNNDDKIPAVFLMWTAEDIQTKAEEMEIGRDLTKEECLWVLDNLLKKHDCNSGVSWQTIEYWINEVIKKTGPPMDLNV